MLTGDLPVSSGEIFIQGINLKTNLKEIHKMVGYCGQFDAHIEELTGRETLTFYAKCRGIKHHEVKNCILKLATDFDFVDHLDKQVRFFSGGNKRKLSTAIALIGNPQIIFLDEPTSFMDPLVKKKFWCQIEKLRDSGKTIFLSSHSMDEVEILCTRIGIMINGELKCLGSPQYLKSKFGKTIVVTLKLKKIEVNDSAKYDMKRFIDQQLPGAILK
jgi:ATP-binding cassette subfamily A (ABC1) protein 3